MDNQPLGLNRDGGPEGPSHVRLRRKAARPLRRVLVLSHLFPHPKQPALGPFVLEQVRSLRRHEGIEARVVCGLPFWMNTLRPWPLYRALRVYRQTFDKLRWRKVDEVPVVYVPYLAGGYFQHALHGMTYRNAMLRAAGWLARRFRFDLLHAHTGYPDGPAARALAHRLGIPYVLTEHTNPFAQLMTNCVVRRQTLQALAGAARVWCVSSPLRQEVESYLGPACCGHVRLLPNGVDVAAFRLAQGRRADPAATRLLSVTALEPYKNPMLLLRAFRRLRQTLPGARLTVVAGGTLEAEVHAYLRGQGLEGSVTLLGRQPRQEIARLMREECDVFVLSSDSETFGVVLIEALASGKPVVSTDCGGPRDVVTEPWLGRLCPPGNEEALAAALAEVIGQLGSVDSARIRQHAVERFDYRSLAQSLRGEYERVLAETTGGVACRAA